MFIASVGLIGTSNIQTRKQEMNAKTFNQNCLKVEEITGVVKAFCISKLYRERELEDSRVLIMGYVSV